MSDKILRAAVIKLATENPPLRAVLVPLLRQATEFPSEKALKDYLHEHPDADKSKHSVKQDSSGGDKPHDDSVFGPKGPLNTSGIGDKFKIGGPRTHHGAVWDNIGMEIKSKKPKSKSEFDNLLKGETDGVWDDFDFDDPKDQKDAKKLLGAINELASSYGTTYKPDMKLPF